MSALIVIQLLHNGIFHRRDRIRARSSRINTGYTFTVITASKSVDNEQVFISKSQSCVPSYRIQEGRLVEKHKRLIHSSLK